MTSKRVASLFIVANSLTAGSIFCFPLFGPRITADLGLSLSQTNAIWSAAVVGQYASAAIFGHIADTYGPRPLSFLASGLFGAGYTLMSRLESGAVAHRLAGLEESERRTRGNFVAMATYFLLVGTGVAASLFSALRSSTAHFRSHPGLSLSVPLTLFSLSSLFLSAFASLPFFTDRQTGDLNSPRFLAWLGAALMVTNLFSAFGLSAPNVEWSDNSTQPRQAEESTEQSPLLGGEECTSRLRHALPYSVPFYKQASEYTMTSSLTLKEYLSVPAVWTMAFILFAAVGGAEMVMSSIGSMVVSLKTAHTLQLGVMDDDENARLGKETLALRAQQVQLLAVANTLARLIVGLVSDLYSPQPSKGKARSLPTSQDNDESWMRRLRHGHLSRLTMILCGLTLLLITFLYSALLLESVDRLWIISLATGAGYGLTFTLLPSIILCIWPQEFGRNYGILTYAAALGSLCFSMLFARVNDGVAERHRLDDHPAWTLAEHSTPSSTPSSAICAYGRECFAPSFGLAAFTVAVALIITIPLRRAWKTRV